MKTGKGREKESRVWQALFGEENMNSLFVAFLVILFCIMMFAEVKKIIRKLSNSSKEVDLIFCRRIITASIVSTLLLSVGIYFLFFAAPSTEIPIIGIMGAIYGWFHKVAASG